MVGAVTVDADAVEAVLRRARNGTNETTTRRPHRNMKATALSVAVAEVARLTVVQVPPRGAAAAVADEAEVHRTRRYFEAAEDAEALREEDVADTTITLDMKDIMQPQEEDPTVEKVNPTGTKKVPMVWPRGLRETTLAINVSIATTAKTRMTHGDMAAKIMEMNQPGPTTQDNGTIAMTTDRMDKRRQMTPLSSHRALDKVTVQATQPMEIEIAVAVIRVTPTVNLKISITKAKAAQTQAHSRKVVRTRVSATVTTNRDEATGNNRNKAPSGVNSNNSTGINKARVITPSVKAIMCLVRAETKSQTLRSKVNKTTGIPLRATKTIVSKAGRSKKTTPKVRTKVKAKAVATLRGTSKRPIKAKAANNNDIPGSNNSSSRKAIQMPNSSNQTTHGISNSSSSSRSMPSSRRSRIHGAALPTAAAAVTTQVPNSSNIKLGINSSNTSGVNSNRATSPAPSSSRRRPHSPTTTSQRHRQAVRRHSNSRRHRPVRHHRRQRQRQRLLLRLVKSSKDKQGTSFRSINVQYMLVLHVSNWLNNFCSMYKGIP